MNGSKLNRSVVSVGHGRGVPIRLARAIARKYRLLYIVIFTYDEQHRERIVTFGNNPTNDHHAAQFGALIARKCNWPKAAQNFESAPVRKLRSRIRELETALAQIIDGCADPAGLARTAGKFPVEDEEENLGEWIFFPQGKMSRGQRLLGADRPADIERFNVLTPEQLGAESIRDLAYWTWRKLCNVNFGNISGEIEVAIAHGLRRFGGHLRRRPRA